MSGTVSAISTKQSKVTQPAFRNSLSFGSSKRVYAEKAQIFAAVDELDIPDLKDDDEHDLERFDFMGIGHSMRTENAEQLNDQIDDYTRLKEQGKLQLESIDIQNAVMMTEKLFGIL